MALVNLAPLSIGLLCNLKRIKILLFFISLLNTHRSGGEKKEGIAALLWFLCLCFLIVVLLWNFSDCVPIVAHLFPCQSCIDYTFAKTMHFLKISRKQ